MESFINGLSLGSVLTFFFERRLYQEGHRIKRWFNDDRKPIFGYHFHHSAAGLIILIIGLCYLLVNKSHALFLIGMGLGIIAVHTDSERRLVFIEKEGSKKLK